MKYYITTPTHDKFVTRIFHGGPMETNYAFLSYAIKNAIAYESFQSAYKYYKHLKPGFKITSEDELICYNVIEC